MFKYSKGETKMCETEVKYSKLPYTYHDLQTVKIKIVLNRSEKMAPKCWIICILYRYFVTSCYNFYDGWFKFRNTFMKTIMSAYELALQ